MAPYGAPPGAGGGDPAAGSVASDEAAGAGDVAAGAGDVVASVGLGEAVGLAVVVGLGDVLGSGEVVGLADVVGLGEVVGLADVVGLGEVPGLGGVVPGAVAVAVGVGDAVTAGMCSMGTPPGPRTGPASAGISLEMGTVPEPPLVMPARLRGDWAPA